MVSADRPSRKSRRGGTELDRQVRGQDRKACGWGWKGLVTCLRIFMKVTCMRTGSQRPEKGPWASDPMEMTVPFKEWPWAMFSIDRTPPTPFCTPDSGVDHCT